MATIVSGFAYLNGVDVFGLVTKWSTIPNPVERQINAYPGVDGLQSVRMGARGGRMAVEGVWVGPDPFTVAAFEALALYYEQDGGAYTVIDLYGNVWPNTILESYHPDGRLLYGGVAGTAFVAKVYTMTLLHQGA